LALGAPHSAPHILALTFEEEPVVIERKKTMRKCLMARRRYVVLHGGKRIG
jgi:hypothetical protein